MELFTGFFLTSLANNLTWKIFNGTAKILNTSMECLECFDSLEYSYDQTKRANIFGKLTLTCFNFAFMFLTSSK